MQKLVTMAIFATLLYGLWEFQNVWRHGMFNEWLYNTFRLRHIIGTIVFNQPLWGRHLWYLYAVIYDLLILYCADKLHLANWLKYATAVLFCVFCIINVTPISDHYFWCTRNFLFMGLPCIMAGRWVKEQNEHFTKFFSSSRIWWTVFVGSFILTIAEMLMLRWLNIGNRMGMREMYIFTIPFLLSVFYWTLQHPSFGEGSILATIGRKYSAYIYVFHLIVGQLICHFLPYTEERFKHLLLTIAIFIGSLLLSWAFCKTKDKMRGISFVR